MKDWFIIFQDEMVRAILEGHKTQTRRLSDRWAKLKKGDRLLVKECWKPCFTPSTPTSPGECSFLYRADGAKIDNERAGGYFKIDRAAHWRPSIFMSRCAVRIELEATADARRELLQHIMAADAVAEGCPDLWLNKYSNPTGWFERLWSSINKKPGTRWEDNPAVWAIQFRRKVDNAVQI